MRWLGVSVAAMALIAGPARAELVVTISKAQQAMAVAVDGHEAYRWPVSTGRRGHATPSGTFRPIRTERHWYSRQYDLTPMPWSVFFYRGYAVHGTQEVRNLGRVASHGCVRLRPDNAAVLYSLVRKQGFAGTRIVVTDRALPSPPAAEPTSKPVAEQRGRGFDAFGAADGREPARRGRSETVAVQHVEVMKVSSEAELRAIYRKYGFKW